MDDVDELVSKLKNFFLQSETFAGVCFRGFYTMETEVLLIAFKEYLESGNNYLDEYTALFDLYGGINRNNGLEPQVIVKYRKLIENNGFWNIKYRYTEEEINEMLFELNLREAEIENRKEFLKNTDYRNTKEYNDWRKSVFERDNYTCQECKKKGVNLNAHHIYSFKKYPAKRYDLNNGKTLCVSCHRLVHKRLTNNAKN